jgi:hypothetical protein
MPGAPLSASIARPESSAIAMRPDASAAARAFSSAFASNVVPVSSGSASPSSAADFTSKPKGPSRSTISRALPGLWLATTIGPGWRRMSRLS